MNNKVRAFGLFLAGGLLLSASAAWAVLTEPEFTFFGTPSSNGVLLQQGLVTAVLVGQAVPISTYALGSTPEYGNRYVLRVPLDFAEPQLAGTARPGDPIELFIDGILAGTGQVGQRGEVDVVALDTFFDDDPELSIADALVVEGDLGTTDAEFTVSLSRSVDWDVRFDFQTVDGSAVSPGDYAAVSDTAVIPAGEPSVTVVVSVRGDDEAEPTESFQVVLSNPVDDVPAPQAIATVIADGEAVGTISADDTRYVINIADVQILETDEGEEVEVVFIVSVPDELPTGDSSATSASVAKAVPPPVMLEVDFTTVDGTATAGDDYVATSGRLTIDTGVRCDDLPTPCGEIRVAVRGNTEKEPDETFTVELSNPSHGVIGDGQGLGTIIDDEHLLLFVERENGGLPPATGLLGAVASAVSPDGAHLYSVAAAGNSLSVFQRSAVNGALAFQATLSDGIGGVEGLGGAASVALSPDGRQVYTAAYLDDAVAVFGRDPATGDLTFVESHVQGADGVTGLDGVVSVAVSPDGRAVNGGHLYAAGLNSDAVAVFARALDGRLTFVGAVQNGVGGVSGLLGAAALALSPGGKHLYVASFTDSSVVAFSRDGSSGMLTFVERETDGLGGVDGLDGAASLAVSRDGAHVYVVGRFDDAIAVFRRDAKTGELTFVQRRKNGVGNIVGLDGVSGIAVDGAGEYVYTASTLDSALAVFARDPATGKLEFVEARRDGDPDPYGLPDASGLRRLDGLAEVTGVTVSRDPDVSNVYLSSTGDNALAVFVQDRRAPDVTVVTTSRPPGVWSNDPMLNIVWTARDNGGAGLGGYPRLADASAVTDPGFVYAQPHLGDQAAPQDATVGPLPEGMSGYFHLRACDRLDNCSAPAHVGPFWTDTVGPGAPVNVVGSNQTNNDVGDPRAILMSWESARDGASGLGGYAYAFDMNPTWACTETKNLRAKAVGVASPEVPVLTDGMWYFHVCAVDLAGNWSAAVDAGEFIVGVIASAGLDATIDFGDSIVLGEDPTAVGGTPPYTYVWTVDPLMDGRLDSTSSANPTFTGERVDDYVVQVVATDSLGRSSAPSEIEIRVVCPLAKDLDLYNVVSTFGRTEETSRDRIVAELYRVTSESEVAFRAGETIVLGEGFVVESDGVFTAITGASPCGRDEEPEE